MKTDHIILQAQAKVSRQFVHELAQLTGLTKRDLAWLIGRTERTLYKTPKSDFSILISEHLLLLQSLFQEGLAIFDQNKKAFILWLKTPQLEVAFSQPELATLASNPSPLNKTLGSQPNDRMGKAKQPEQQAPLISLPSSPEVAPYPTPFSLLNTKTGIRLVATALTHWQAGAYCS